MSCECEVWPPVWWEFGFGRLHTRPNSAHVGWTPPFMGVFYKKVGCRSPFLTFVWVSEGMVDVWDFLAEGGKN